MVVPVVELFVVVPVVVAPGFFAVVDVAGGRFFTVPVVAGGLLDGREVLPPIMPPPVTPPSCCPTATPIDANRKRMANTNRN